MQLPDDGANAAEATCSVRMPGVRDLAEIAALFVDAFGGHPIAAMPPRLRRRFIAAHIAEKLALVACDDATGRIIGFTIAGRRIDLDRARRNFIFGNVVHLAYHALLPKGRALRVRRSKARSEHSSPCTDYELRYIAVSAFARGRGVGSALLRALESGSLGNRPYYAWVLAERPAALRFYYQHGFGKEFQSDGHLRLVKMPPLRP
jgi:ribosomal protein S18 acetylase RimI-like enzyme